MKASDIFVKALEREGVEYIFGIPGEENLDFLNSLRDSSIKLILTRHEQGAGFMAATYGRLTGKPGVCLSTLGPGATNFVTPAAYAKLGAMPMAMLTGQKPIHKSKQGRFQIVDIVDMMKPLTKYTKQVAHGVLVASTVREAFKIAQDERPGHVHIELPEDVADHHVDDTHIIDPKNERRPVADYKSLLRAKEMIEAAKNPMILVGAGANRKLIAKQLKNFAEKLQIPVFCTQMGKGVFDERSPLFIGTAALSSKDYLHCAIDKADLIINVGHDVVEKPPFFMEPNSDQKVIHINFSPSEIDNVYFPQLDVVGDIATTLWELFEQVEPQDFDTSYSFKVRDLIQEHIAEKANDPRFPLIPQRIVSDIRDTMEEEDIITLDNGMYKLWFARNYPVYKPNTILLDNALATMGAGLPSAMTAALLNPNKRIAAICGDGGFMMNSQEIETAVRMGLNLVVIILNDQAYQMIKWKQNGMGFEDFGLDFNNPEFVKYAESYGAHGHQITSADEFKTTLESCFKAGGVHLIDLPIDYSENVKVLTEELQNKSCPA